MIEIFFQSKGSISIFIKRFEIFLVWAWNGQHGAKFFLTFFNFIPRQSMNSIIVTFQKSFHGQCVQLSFHILIHSSIIVVVIVVISTSATTTATTSASVVVVV